MRVRLITLMCGPEGNYSPGDIADLPTPIALELVRGGFAAPVEPITRAAEIEVAELPAVIEMEVADAPQKRGRKKGV